MLVRETDDRFDVELGAVAIADVRDRDELRLLVDDASEALRSDLPRLVLTHVRDACSARLLRVPDLADRRELPVGEDDLVAHAGKPQPAGE